MMIHMLHPTSSHPYKSPSTTLSSALYQQSPCSVIVFHTPTRGEKVMRCIAHWRSAFCFYFSSTAFPRGAFGFGFGALPVSSVAQAVSRESMTLGEEGDRSSTLTCPAMVEGEEQASPRGRAQFRWGRGRFCVSRFTGCCSFILFSVWAHLYGLRGAAEMGSRSA